MATHRDRLGTAEVEGSASGAGSAGVEVVLLSDPATPAPLCPHGPTLLFAKVSHGKEETRRFYACSACRDRKDCDFFQWEDEKLSGARLAAREARNRRCQPPLSRTQCVERYLQFVELPASQRKFCRQCQQLLLPNDWGEHQEHQVVGDISVAQLKRPSRLLSPLENKKTNAQYLFADRSCQFLVDLLSTLGFRRVLCVGTPRLHELIRLKASGDEKSNIKSLLLDIDYRYSQFYMEDSFCHYNMFNHHFFDGKMSTYLKTLHSQLTGIIGVSPVNFSQSMENFWYQKKVQSFIPESMGEVAALEVCRTFVQGDNGKALVMVTDPPFGGLVEPLAVTFKKIIAMWKKGQSQDNTQEELPIFWIFPYFFESRICQFFPSFRMLDYQVDYDNHALYKHGKTGRKQSPVRIFTNIPPNKIALPAEEGYRFCPLCQRHVSLENRHCEHCGSCTSKDGRKWNHCFLCKKCVKPSWIHCSTCNCCALPDHSCEGPKDGCFICGELDHKRSTCPNISVSKKVNNIVRKQKQRKSNKMKMETATGQSMNQASATKKKKRRERVHQYLCS